MLCIIFIFTFVVFGVSTTSAKCKLSDTACMVETGNGLYKKLFEAKSVELDPMYQKVIDGNLSVLQCKLKDNTISGMKNCTIKSVNLELEDLFLELELLCPRLLLRGNYDVKGRLLIFAVDGVGEYTIDTKSYNLKLRSDIKVVSDNGGQHVYVTNFKVTAEPLDSIVYNFKSSLNGQKDVAESVQKFANDNWREVAKEVQGPVFNAIFKKLIQESNKILKSKVLGDYIEE